VCNIILTYKMLISETDTLFGGVSAFPKSSTIIQGLRAKKKYKGYEAKKSWP
jgi:large subunit ribosomal protein L50